jgi:hypothetical protein
MTDSRDDDITIARLQARIERLESIFTQLQEQETRKYGGGYEVRASPEFMIDFQDDGAPTWALFVMRDERSVLLEVRGIVNDDRQIIGHDNSITYSVATPSLDRHRAGYRGELANDSSERIVESATVEDLITALQWLVGKETLRGDPA